MANILRILEVFQCLIGRVKIKTDCLCLFELEEFQCLIGRVKMEVKNECIWHSYGVSMPHR